MKRALEMMAAAWIAAATSVACGGEIRTDVDAGPEAGFDLDAHWGECCYDYKGPITLANCKDGDGGFIDKHDPGGQCLPTQYCGVVRDICFNGDQGGCHRLHDPPFGCCGNRPPSWLIDASYTGIWDYCLPYGIDDASGLPPVDGSL